MLIMQSLPRKVQDTAGDSTSATISTLPVRSEAATEAASPRDTVSSAMALRAATPPATNISSSIGRHRLNGADAPPTYAAWLFPTVDRRRAAAHRVKSTVSKSTLATSMVTSSTTTTTIVANTTYGISVGAVLASRILGADNAPTHAAHASGIILRSRLPLSRPSAHTIRMDGSLRDCRGRRVCRVCHVCPVIIARSGGVVVFRGF